MKFSKGRYWGMMGAAGLLLFLRKPDALLNPQFFAEDGTVFFIGARQLGWPAVFTSYGGYVHLLPRLVAGAAGYLDPAWIPLAYNVAAGIFDLSVVALLFSPRVRLPAKPALALAFVLAPHTGEVFLSLTNIQWSLALVLLLVVISGDGKNSGARAFDLGAVVLGGLTGPFLCFLTPLFIIRAAVRRTRDSVVLAVGVLLVGGIQLGYLFANRNHFGRPAPAEPAELLSSLGARLYGTFFAGYGINPELPPSFWLTLGAAVTVLAGGLAFRPGEFRGVRVTLALAWLCVVVPVGLKFLHEARAIKGAGSGDRYFFLPHVLLAWVLIVACVQGKGWLRAVPAALLAVAFAGNLRFFTAASLVDYAWAQHVQPIREGESFEIPINPPGSRIEGRSMPQRH